MFMEKNMAENRTQMPSRVTGGVGRRTLLKVGLTAGALQFTRPFIAKAQGGQKVKLGLNDPLTGTYAALGQNEQIGCEYAIEQINQRGGILGREAVLIVEDSTSADVGTAVQKARKLFDRDNVDFLLGNVNSAMALALGQVSNEAKKFHIVTGGHTDAVTGTDCHWNVFRVCNTTQMEANAVASSLIKIGKKWYYITPDYAFGHTLQAGLEKACAKLGGSKAGGDLVPLGTTEFSSYLIKAQSANPDIIIFLMAGDDMVNALKQAVQFGLDKRFHLAGAQQELEVLEGLPPEALIGTWVFEWYWKQPGVAHVDEFVAAIRKKTGKVPTARTWFGYVAAWTCALVANQQKTLDARKLAQAMQNFVLPPEVALMPHKAFYRVGQNQLMPTLYVGHAQKAPAGGDKEDLFAVAELVDGSAEAIAGTVEESGCKLALPA
jgi:branched-chain amino acid transport system substrate-binding protein